MTDLFAGRGVYQDLSIPERIDILNHAVNAIAGNFYVGVGVHFDRVEFEAEAPKDWPRYFGSIYSVACQMCLQSTAFMLDRLKSHLPVLYVFERGHKFRAEADAFLTAIGKHDESRKYYRYRQHIFEEKEAEFGLQAADLMAWTVTKARLGGRHPSMRPFLDPLMRLAQTAPERQMIHSFTGETLLKFIESQLTGRREVIAQVGPRKRAFR